MDRERSMNAKGWRRAAAALMAILGLGVQMAACAQPPPPPPPGTLDQQLRGLIQNQGLSGDPARGRELPRVDTPMAQLGMRLFFSKSLGGSFEAACASCHHPALGGADRLSLPVGIDAVHVDLLGPGRMRADGTPNVARNAPTIFNIGLYDHALFHDGRVESLAPAAGANGAGGGIRTPDSAFGQPDPRAGTTLPAAQARFPVTVFEEMRERLLPAGTNAQLRQRLAARLGNYGAGAGELPDNRWLPLFQQAFGQGASARTVVSFDHIAEALAAYQRSFVFTNTPWRAYVAGNNAAIGDAAKRGALLFLGAPQRGGAGCAGCHRGDFFTDERFHTVAFPMIGPGKGDGPRGRDDFGRERESSDPAGRYAVRTPTLLNVALTAPYGHHGSYATLTQAVRHYRNPRASVDAFFNAGSWCRLAQFASLPAAQCSALYPDAHANSRAALDKLQQDNAAGRGLPPIRLEDGQVADIVAFLNTLSDRCARDRRCLGRWIPPDDGGPDGQQLQAVNEQGEPL
jgi:cytochrome c peroxidase